jgi:DNA polymerase I-like protein with 3'-5' exonuclease and polymerase domains
MDDPHKACNYKIQGSAGYMIGEAMINVHNNPDYKESGARMVNQMHDSIVIQVEEARATPELRSSLQESIEAAGLKYLPTCKATFKTIYPHETQI